MMHYFSYICSIYIYAEREGEREGEGWIRIFLQIDDSEEVLLIIFLTDKEKNRVKYFEVEFG